MHLHSHGAAQGTDLSLEAWTCS